MTTTSLRPAVSRILATAVAPTALAAGLLLAPAVTRPVSALGEQQPQARSRPSLSQPVPNLTLEETPFEDALNFIQNLTGITFFVDWQRLEMAGVDRTTPVSIQLRNVSARKTLQLMLDAASPLEPLTFYADAGVIHVTTQEHADSELVLRLYDVRDLLIEIPDFEGPGLGGGGGSFGGGGGGGGLGGGGGGLGGGGGGLSGGGGGGGLAGGGGGMGGGGGGYGGGGGGGGGLGGGGGGGTGGGGTGGDLGTAEERAEELIELITEVIRPDVWEVNGGTATIRYFNGNLVVNAPRSVHELL